MDELLDGIKPKKSSGFLGIKLSGILELIFYAVTFSVGFSAIVTSDSSIITNSNLEARIEYLKKQIDILNKQNAELQKDYFELLSIQGDYAN